MKFNIEEVKGFKKERLGKYPISALQKDPPLYDSPRLA